jgi:hypothetical protein
MKLLSRVIIFLCLVSPVHARSHCPHGDIYRVHLQRCVARGSSLALVFNHHTRELRQARSEIPSHHGITYVTVIEPPPSTPVEINIPYRLPYSRWDHPAIVHFDALPPVVPGALLSNTARKE